MIIFRQKVYAVDPEKVSINSDGDYQSSIINSGGDSGTSLRNSSSPANSVALAPNLQQAPQSNINTFLEANNIKAKMDRLQMTKKRAEIEDRNRVASLTQSKKQLSIRGIQNAKEEERKLNAVKGNLYKVPTVSKSPILSRKSKK